MQYYWFVFCNIIGFIIYLALNYILQNKITFLEKIKVNIDSILIKV